MTSTDVPARANSSLLGNRIRTFLSKPHNVILLLLGIVLTVTTIAPIIAIVQDTVSVHPGTRDAILSHKTEGWTLVNYVDLFTSRLARSGTPSSCRRGRVLSPSSTAALSRSS